MAFALICLLFLLCASATSGWLCYRAGRPASDFRYTLAVALKATARLVRHVVSMFGRHPKLIILIVLIGVLVYTSACLLAVMLPGLTFLMPLADMLPESGCRWDILLFTALVSVHFIANLEGQDTDGIPGNVTQPMDILNFKNYAATALKDASTSYIAAVSILIPASFVIVQLGRPAPPDSPPPGIPEALPIVFRAVCWFVLSLVMG